MKTLSMPSRFILVLALSVVCLSGCKKKDKQQLAPSSTTAAPAAAANTVRTLLPMQIKRGNGEALAILEPNDGQFRIKDAFGAKIGKIKIEADRVKYKDHVDHQLAKVKCKGKNTFKIYSGEETVVAKVSLNGTNVKIVAEDKSDIARGDTTSLDTKSGSNVKLAGAVGTVVVEQSSKPLYVIEGAPSPLGALIMGVDAIPESARIATLVFLSNVTCVD